MSVAEKIKHLLFPSQKDLNYISTKRDMTMLALTVIVILFTFFNYRLVFLDMIAILGYYFMPKYAYNDSGVWRITGKKKKLYFSWKDVKEIDLNGDNLYFLLKNDKIVKIDGVRDAYRIFIVIKNKI
ncbi:hypothetical protein J5U23_02900 [Saccharolobus shibatae B12]|uniref:Uncharacterized protein n=1 Tax=Saccharolobus shibatae (strain ATCC 51178 / DSM 5389 / JCM 8931 / NBRC 15437 / B12) TaxID=523848 RepID=A0A8F5GRG4_SACSH|nr:hypothetical protein [Saccharolobus shibatae]QXJ27118.1 hypothetical protein J5U23_p2900 [Saccharolobus shibatae B12]QXJ30011.1 hypothetical protein J5U23_02900 [Saccharolobus shibatae B12]